MAGGGLKAASMGWLAGTDYEDALHFDLARIHQEFMMRIPFWEMEPSDQLVTRGYAMSDPGEEYVVYLPNGGSVGVNVQDAIEPLNVEWLDTETGQTLHAPPVDAQGWTDFTAPNSGSWVLYLHEDPVAGTPDDSETPGGPLVLHPSSPNPARFETAISFVIPSRGPIDLFVYDVSGRRVSKIYRNSVLEAGHHRVAFDTRRLRPGSYFYRLDAAGESTTQKFFVVR
jgi:hypothetical protein